MINNKKHRCPKCHIQLTQYAGIDTGNYDSSLADKWVCPKCGYKEEQSFWDSQMEKHYGK